MKNAVIAIVSVVAALAVVAGGAVGLWMGAGKSATAQTTGTVEGAGEVAPLAAGLPNAEGIVYAGEYANNLYDAATGMSLFWENDGTYLYVAAISPGTGWVGVGFSSRPGKPGSNILLGAVADGMVTIQDNYGVTRVLHLADKTPSVVSFGGSEDRGETTLEFVIPLSSGDSQDTALVPGQTVYVILAYQATRDSFTSEHTRYSMTQIALD